MTANLPRLQSSVPIVDLDQNGTPSYAFHVWWDQFATKLEGILTDLSVAIADIATAQATANTAIADAAAAAAQALAASTAALSAATAALAAQNAADLVKRDDSISTSWTSPGAILSATDAGSDVTLDIASHVRKYSDSSSVSVTGSSIGGLAYSTLYYVYYDQPSRAGGAVTYHADTDPNVAKANSVGGRHECGIILTPAALAGPTDGGYTPPGGYTGPHEIP